MDAESGIPVNVEGEETPVMDTVLDQEVPMPEINENYVNASVMFMRGNTYSREKAIWRKRYSDVNAVRRKNDKPILDTYNDIVEFD